MVSSQQFNRNVVTQDLIDEFVSPFTASWKQKLASKRAAAERDVTGTIAPDQNRVAITFSDRVNGRKMADAIRNTGAVPQKFLENINAWKTWATAEQVTRLQNIQSVVMIDNIETIPLDEHVGTPVDKIPASAIGGTLNTNELRRILNVESVHNRGITGQGARVGIVDGGRINTGHPAFSSSNLIGQHDYANVGDNGHGCGSTSMIVGQDTSVRGYPMKGMAPDADYFVWDTKDDDGSGLDGYYIKDAMQEAKNKDMDVVNASFGSPTSTGASCGCARNADIFGTYGVLCAATGNDYGEKTNTWAACSFSIGVGACDENNDRYGFSNYGSRCGETKPDVCGRSSKGGTYVASTGTSGVQGFGWTSGATPQVSGVATLLVSAGANADASEIENLLQDTGQLGGRNQYVGYGLVDADAAVQQVDGGGGGGGGGGGTPEAEVQTIMANGTTLWSKPVDRWG